MSADGDQRQARRTTASEEGSDGAASRSAPIALVARVAVALVGADLVVAQRPTTRANRRAAAIQAQLQARLSTNLPSGSASEQIERELTKGQIGYSYVADEHRFYALIPDVQKGFLISEDLQISINVDDQRRLVSIEVTSVYTGL